MTNCSCSEGVLEPRGVCVCDSGCSSLAAQGWCCVVVPGSEGQVQGAGHRGDAQGAGVPVHRGADSAAGSHLPPPVRAHLVPAGQGTDISVLSLIHISAFMTFSNTCVRLTDIIHVQVEKNVSESKESGWLIVPGTVTAGSWPLAVRICVTLIPATITVCLQRGDLKLSETMQ